MKTIHVIDKEGKEYMKITYNFNKDKITDDGFFIDDISFTSVDTLLSDPTFMEIMTSVERRLKDEKFIRKATSNEINEMITHDIPESYLQEDGYKDALIIELQKFIDSECDLLEMFDEQFKVVTEYYYNKITSPKPLINDIDDDHIDKKGLINLLSTVSETLKDLSNEINKFIKENE